MNADEVGVLTRIRVKQHERQHRKNAVFFCITSHIRIYDVVVLEVMSMKYSKNGWKQMLR